MAKCLIIKNDGIGDLIIASGLIAQLARLFPGGLDLLTCGENREVASAIPGVNGVIYVSRDSATTMHHGSALYKKIKNPLAKRLGGLPYSKEALDRRAFRTLLTTKYDVAISLRRFVRFTTATFMTLTRAKEKYSCWTFPTNLKEDVMRKKSRGWNNIIPDRGVLWEPLYYKKFLERIFEHDFSLAPSLVWPSSSASEETIALDGIGLIITDRPPRSWPDSYWDQTMGELLKLNVPIYLFGNKDDREDLRGKYRGHPLLHDFCGQLALLEHVRYFARLSAILAEDTGLAHLAALSGSKVLVLQADGSNNGFFFPWRSEASTDTYTIFHSMPCNDYSLPTSCFGRCQKIGDRFRCISKVVPDAVIPEFLKMLSGALLTPQIDLAENHDKAVASETLLRFAKGVFADTAAASGDITSSQAYPPGEVESPTPLTLLLRQYEAQKMRVSATPAPAERYVMAVGGFLESGDLKCNYLRLLFDELKKRGVGFSLLNVHSTGDLFTPGEGASVMHIPAVLNPKISCSLLSAWRPDLLAGPGPTLADDDRDIADYALKSLSCRYTMANATVIKLIVHLSIDYIKFLFQSHKPSQLLLWNQFTTWNVLIAHYAQRFSIPIRYMEHGPLPGSLCFDRQGQMGESWPATAPEEFNSLEFSSAEIACMGRHIEMLRQSGANRRPQPKGSVREKLLRFQKNRPLLLYAGQNDFESGILPYTEKSRQYHSPIFESSRAALEYLDRLAKKKNWALIYKPHPYLVPNEEQIKRLKLSPNTIMIPTADINELIDLADVTITILSTVSYLALIRKKPVVMLGYTQLRYANATYNAFHLDEVERGIQAALRQGYTADQIQGFTAHAARLAKYYLYDGKSDIAVPYSKDVSELADEIVGSITNDVGAVEKKRLLEMEETTVPNGLERTSEGKRTAVGASTQYADFAAVVDEVAFAPQDNTYSEMSAEELRFLIYFLRRKNPRRVIEAGVSAGGTTCYILEELSKDATLSSIDIKPTWYHDKSKEPGFSARQMYDETRHAKWQTFWGQDVSNCIMQIGSELDFFVLDTAHVLPGEFLSFFVVLPFLADQAVLVLHDTALHVKRIFQNDPRPGQSKMYCNLLLFSSIMAPDKFLLPNRQVSNIGAVIIDKKKAIANINNVINMLYLPWAYVPGDDLINKTAEIMRSFYKPASVELFLKAVEFNKSVHKK
jgi:ADP-heptose:LPS heptosyltransferase